MLPKLAVVDPKLTLGLPRGVTASTGLDALTQLIEPYVGVRANPMTDLFCLEGIPPRRQRPTACLGRRRRPPGTDGYGLGQPARGLALANAGLGAVHGFAAPVGGMFPAPHGAACAALLPHAIAVNIQALRTRAPASHALGRYAEVARLLTGRPQATAEDAVRWTAEICKRLEIPPLRAYGVTEAISLSWWRKPRKPAA